jgi:hypothetical protein
MHELTALMAEVPDFPGPGILIGDFGPLLRDRFSRAIVVRSIPACS